MQYRQALVNIPFRPRRMIKRIRLLQSRFYVRVTVCRKLFNKLVIGRIHRLISHIVCLLVIAVNAVINTAQDIKGSRDS